MHTFDSLSVYPDGCLPDYTFQFELDVFAVPFGRDIDLFAVPGGPDVAVLTGEVQDLRLLEGRLQFVRYPVSGIVCRTGELDGAGEGLRVPTFVYSGVGAV